MILYFEFITNQSDEKYNQWSCKIYKEVLHGSDENLIEIDV